MTKILHVIGKRPVGGIGAFVYNYQCHFKSKELQIDYLLFDDAPNGPFDDKVKALGSNVYVLPALKNTRLFYLWRKIDAFMQHVGCQYDAIHLHSVNIAFMCFPCAKKYGVKHLISHSHATVYSDKKLNALRNKILCKNLMNYATDYCACSVAAGTFLYGKDNMDKVTVFNNAIECDKFRFDIEIREEVREALQLQNKYVIGNVGRFCEQKNQLFLLDIFAQCVKKNENAILMLVGDGPQIGEVKEKAKKIGVYDKVLFMGRRNDVPRLLQAMDVFALPSLFEGLPVIGIEAQAAGLPLVVSDTVTRELDLIGIDFLALDSGVERWSDNILSPTKMIEREVCWKIVTDKGYEIEKEAKRLVSYYQQMS